MIQFDEDEEMSEDPGFCIICGEVAKQGYKHCEGCIEETEDEWEK